MYPKRKTHRITDQSCRQLDAIETALTQVVSLVTSSEAANDANYAANDNGAALKVVRTTKSLDLIRQDRSLLPTLPTLQLRPLFFGSHSQTEIVIDNINETRSASLPEEKNARLQALDPALFFTRFNDPKFNRDLLIDKQAINLILVLPLEHPQDRQSLVAHLAEFSSAISIATHITLLTWNVSSREHHAWQQSLHKDICAQLKRTVSTRLHTIGMDNDDSTSLFTQLGQHDMALMPNIGLTLDALNTGCASGLWTAPNAGPAQLKTLQGPITDSIRRRQVLQKLAEQQRYDIVLASIDHQVNQSITTRSLSLFNAVDCFYRHQDYHPANELTQSASTPSPYDQLESVLSVNVQQGEDDLSRWFHWLDRIRRKSRKLLHSPGQFFSDSSSSLLRYMAGRMIGREERKTP